MCVFALNIFAFFFLWDFPDGTSGKRIHLPIQEMQETQVQYLGWEDPLEEDMATHFTVLGWRIPWTEEPSGLKSTRSQSDLTE